MGPTHVFRVDWSLHADWDNGLKTDRTDGCGSHGWIERARNTLEKMLHVRR